jgi:hypothetical protein
MASTLLHTDGSRMEQALQPSGSTIMVRSGGAVAFLSRRCVHLSMGQPVAGTAGD